MHGGVFSIWGEGLGGAFLWGFLKVCFDGHDVNDAPTNLEASGG